MKQLVLIRSFRPYTVFCFAIVLCCALLVVPVVTYAEKSAAVKSGKTLTGKIIAIDAGHGGSDPGAIGFNGTAEKEINLLLALKLQALLEEKGAVVIMTRTDDTAYSDVKKEDLDHRAKIVTKKKAELFISIQCNAVPGSSYHGAQVFYYPESEEGKLLAESIQDSLVEKLKNTDRKALTLSSAYIMYVLDIPAIIVETGFLSNPEEEALLNDKNYQEKVVAAIYGGIVNYYNKQDSKESWLDFIFDRLHK
ncbi:MAG TPA: N-acetylmuramoyl-L-alanine amidase [Clostridiales bacterium]|nr:N-acetylmuramoyl-L-alanine amidase [Clostridiales bacterium]